MVIDALVRHFTNGKKKYDRNAEMAGEGNALPGLLRVLLRDKYFSAPPPKTTGREQYGEKYFRTLLSQDEARRARAEDVIRTATIFTALSILDAFHRFVAPRAKIGELIVSGGGARNPRRVSAAPRPGVETTRHAPSFHRGLGVTVQRRSSFTPRDA